MNKNDNYRSIIKQAVTRNTVNFKTGIVTSERFAGKELQLLDGITEILKWIKTHKTKYPPYCYKFHAFCGVTITKTRCYYVEYVQDRASIIVRQHERMHFFEALVKHRSGGNRRLYPEMLADTMSIIHLYNTLKENEELDFNELVGFHKSTPSLDKRIQLMREVFNALELFNKLDKEISK